MRDTNSSSTSLDCSRESRLTSASDCSLSGGFFSDDGVLFPAALRGEVFGVSEVGPCDWLGVVWEGCWPGEAGLALLCASAVCSGCLERMISATLSCICLTVCTFHSVFSSPHTNRTLTGLFMRGVLHRMVIGSFPSIAARALVLPLPAMPYMTTLSMQSSMWPFKISDS